MYNAESHVCAVWAGVILIVFVMSHCASLPAQAVWRHSFAWLVASCMGDQGLHNQHKGGMSCLVVAGPGSAGLSADGGACLLAVGGNRLVERSGP